MMSKAQKKNQKRAEKRAVNKVENDVKEEVLDPVEALKEKMAEAKANEDHKQVAELRKDLWVLQDTLCGHNPDLPQAEVNQSLQRVEKLVKDNKTSRSAEKCGNLGTYNHPIDLQDKTLVKLHKKLEQIETLKSRKASGEKLEKNQLTKIESENDVRREIEEYLEMKRALHGTNSV